MTDPLQLGLAAAEQAEANASEEWRETVYLAFESVINRKARFTSDDVYEALGGELPPGADPRALGHVFRTYKASGDIESIKPVMYVPSKRRSRHGAPIAVWKSNVHEPIAVPTPRKRGKRGG